MKPARFSYHDPVSRDEALTLLATYADDAKILAGGQSLVPLLNMRLTQPPHLIDINRLNDLAYIRVDTDGLAIGALARHRDIEHTPHIHQLCPLLAEAIPLVGHPPIRSRGTICGSLAHADPAAELPAVLLALDGSVRIEAAHESHVMAAEEFFVSELQTALLSNELLTEAWFPIAPPRTGAACLEVSRRHGDYALVGIAAQVTLAADSTLADVRLALFGIAPTPIRAHTSEHMLIGAHPTPSIFAEVAAQAMSKLDPHTDLHATAAYRRSVAGTLMQRALQLASERAKRESAGEV